MNSAFKRVILWVTLIAVGFVLWKLISTGSNGAKDQEISYSDFKSLVASDKVPAVTILGGDAHGVKMDRSQFHLNVPVNDPDLFKLFEAHHVNVRIKNNDGTQWSLWLVQLAPVILVLGVLCGGSFLAGFFVSKAFNKS